MLLLSAASIRVGRETIRRWLLEENLLWRRHRPVLKPGDPHRAAILRELQFLLRNLPPDEIAVFQHEVDISTNPKIGSMWMPRGRQAELETPGTNQKRYLARSLNWRTGYLIVTEGLKGEGRNSVLFLRHMEDLRTRLLCYRRIHVICDNAVFRDCRAVHGYLAEHSDRIAIHFPPKYAPDLNPIERI